MAPSGPQVRTHTRVYCPPLGTHKDPGAEAEVALVLAQTSFTKNPAASAGYGRGGMPFLGNELPA